MESLSVQDKMNTKTFHKLFGRITLDYFFNTISKHTIANTQYKYTTETKTLHASQFQCCLIHVICVLPSL